MPDDIPQTAEALRDWLRSLKENSGLSYAEIGRAIGEEERNVKRWMTVGVPPVIPRGDIILRLLSALGVTVSPAAPEQVQSLTGQIAQMRDLLGTVDGMIGEARTIDKIEKMDSRIAELEEVVQQAAQGVSEALGRLELAIVDISARLPAPKPRSRRTPHH